MRKIMFFVVLLASLFCQPVFAQQITGVWKGRINRQRVEVKIVQKGDSLTGTSYYFDSPKSYRRYSIKGYFDPETNQAVWWDDQLIDQQSGLMGSPGRMPLLSRADFNCPGSGKMMLDGKSAPVADPEKENGVVDLDKTGKSQFPDEWDFVIDNYMVGGNDPEIIDSIERLALVPKEEVPEPVKAPPVASRTPAKQPVVEKERPKQPEKPAKPVKQPEPVIVEAKPPKPEPKPIPSLTIEEKFSTRKSIKMLEIPITTDSISLDFYDSAEIDGDSISLFLNGKLVFSHIRLLGAAYTLKLAAADLQDENELIMVAENLGSIPPNTSYMVAYVGTKRYSAHLESTENSSAMIRLYKPR